MFAFIRLFFLAFIVLTVIYVCLSLYSRAVRRSKLKAQWDIEGLDTQKTREDRETYIQNGLEEYDGSVRRKLILGVYVIPTAVIAIIIYLTNFA